ncbi:type VI secretion system baseplate subunit TssE [Massilia sp. CCM 9210]|uniref:type VI secretion system baseplate subunit TssE n=1 Tax=Massilia scottii TaxID=3057166 RepID=UPI00279648E6|nr:type VI secretion system baseplate subunit TssE [Massilia sp. CCM 9210]MDQ1812066.1 type VI secretion system baseplate subunit TssE [Massilia sp. CCM 9210]
MQFLFERLATTVSASTGRAEPFDLASAVAAQIGRLVAVRATAPGDEIDLLNFGMPQVVELAHSSRTQLERYAWHLTRLIAHFEPRLTHPAVSLEPRRDSLQPYRLVVSGTLDSAPDTHTFRFDLPAH